MRNIIPLFLVFLLGIVGCTKDQNVECLSEVSNRWAEINNNRLTDSAAITNQLLGDWYLDIESYPFIESTAVCDPEEDIVLKFKDDQTLEVHKNNTLSTTATWNVTDSTINITITTTEETTWLIRGVVSVSNKNLVFFQSLLDGPDFFYKKL